VRIYVDSSALLKRVIEEPESDALEAVLDQHVDAGDALIASSIAWIEISRALMRAPTRQGTDGAARVALSGISECPVSDEIVAVARIIGPPVLRTLDAIHLATAVLLGVERLLTYDHRLIEACAGAEMFPVSPGRED
jgi:uncharacterized protein